MTLRCVIVDDIEAMLRAASDLLERQGVAIVGLARTPEQALHVVGAVRPDIVLVDIDLGAESGFDVARRLVQGVDTAGSRTILISTHDEVEYDDLIAVSPVIGFLSKLDLSAAAIRRLV